MNYFQDTENILFLAVIAAVGYVAYKLYQAFGTSGAYCNDNPSTLVCSLFGGPPGSAGPGKACTGLGCTGALLCSYGMTTFCPDTTTGGFSTGA